MTIRYGWYIEGLEKNEMSPLLLLLLYLLTTCMASNDTRTNYFSKSVITSVSKSNHIINIAHRKLIKRVIE